MVGRVKLKHHNLYERKIQPTFNPSQASPSVHDVNVKVAELFRIISNVFLKDMVGKNIFSFIFSIEYFSALLCLDVNPFGLTKPSDSLET